jgi:hypothetical protein
MAHGVKYRLQYYRLSGGFTTIDILQRGYSSTIYTFKGGASPFEYSWEGDLQDIFTPTTGSGATISVVGTPLAMLELYTADPQEWKVQVWDGVTDTDSDASSDAGGILRWQGFIDARVFSEGYSNPVISEIKINCNDGMSLLDKILYKTTDNYSGKQTVGQIINNVLSKLELSWNLVYTSNDIQITSTDTNPFLYLELFNENFIDENAEPMSCREVLESIMGGLGLSMWFEGDSIYVVDPINLHDTSKGKSYNQNTWGSETPIVLGGYLNITDRDIRWGDNNTQEDIVANVCKAIIKYDPYNFTESTYTFDNEDNWVVEGSFVSQDGGSWYLNNTIEYKNWVISSASNIQIAIKQYEYSAPEYGLQLTDSKEEISYEFMDAVVIEDENICLRLSMEVYLCTKLDSGRDMYVSTEGVEINRLIIPVTVKIGEYYWKGGTDWDNSEDSSGTDKWQELWVAGSELQADYLTSTINGQWVTASIDIPLWGYVDPIISGDVIVEILDDMSTAPVIDDQIIPNTTSFFTAITTAKTNSHGTTGVTWARVTDSSIDVTVVGFKTHANLDDREYLVINNAVTGINTTVPSGSVVSGVWHDVSNNPTAFGSTVAETTYQIISYTTLTDTLIFRITTSGTPYFGVGYNHIESGYSTNMVYNYTYLAVRVFIKDIKIEVVHTVSRENIGNNGIEEKAILSTNLTGEDDFEKSVTSGTGPYGCSRGAFKSSLCTLAGDNIEGLHRGVDSDLYSTTQLCLQSFMSQYKNPRLTLKGRLNMIDQPLNIRTKLIQDSAFLPDKSFYIVSGTYIDKEEMLDVEMIELTDTRETIA